MATTNAQIYQQSQMPIPMPTPSLNPNINSAPTPGPNAMSVYEDCQSPLDTSVSGMYPGDRGSRVVSQPAPLLDQSHLRPGNQANLLSHDRTIELYRENAKKTNDPELIFEFSAFMIDAAKAMIPPEQEKDTNPSPALIKQMEKREEIIKEATSLLKRLADRGFPDAQYFLADCYANGIGTARGKQDFDRAFPLFILAAKHGHPDACYRAGTCCEHGWGCRRDSAKAVSFYKKAAVGLHPGAMYRLGTAELNGALGFPRRPKEGVKWLKRSAEHATEEFPHALHELALLHERGIENVVFVDNDYAAELLAQSAELGYAPSAFKLGECYEYGKMGCPVDPALSIHYYNISAQQDHKDACFALTAWYLVGSPGVLPQSDTEAYLWAKKAAELGLAKAQYAVGYFTETGIGIEANPQAALTWYKQAAEGGDKRAAKRLATGSRSSALDRRLEMEALKEEKRLGTANLAQRSGSGSGASGKDGKDGCLIM
ncbi:protoplast regeneration and killer toxin resistance protein [Cryptococcus neoformans Bt1]|nr:protoplast regeneration and killer toxin resistance protein [Cryptococcus neoformans var. grubii Bt1]